MLTYEHVGGAVDVTEYGALDMPIDLKTGVTFVRISRGKFSQLASELAGLCVTNPWRGAGSAVFLELGRLRKLPHIFADGPSLKGQATVMIEWSWRVEGRRSVQFGSWSGDRKMDNGIMSLKGVRAEAFSLEGSLPELRIMFDDGRALQSFTTIEGQPEWCLFLKDESWLHVARGTLRHERTTA